MASKSKHNLIEALLGIGMGIGGLLLLAYFMWGDALGLGSLTSDTDTTLAQELIELWDACEQGHEVALAEAEDAQLLSASTQWQAVNEEMLMSGADDWSLLFYSPENSTVLDVVVTGGVARVVNQTRVWTAPQVLDEGKWRAGPGDALLTFLAYGGREFIQEHPQAIVDLHLAESDDTGPTWIIVTLDASDQSAFSLLIDSETGQVISTAP